MCHSLQANLIIMKVNRKVFFKKNNIDFTPDNLLKYEQGRTLSELRQWEEYIEKWFKQDIETFFNLQKEKFD